MHGVAVAQGRDQPQNVRPLMCTAIGAASDEFRSPLPSTIRRASTTNEELVFEMDGSTRQEALKRLDVLVGEWVMEADMPGLTTLAGRSVFEWTLDGRFLVQRTEVPVAEAPDSMAIIATDPETGEYTQHYFDARGVVRVYAMSFADGVWQLLREARDFSPSAFRQRFTGYVGNDGNTIRCSWEVSHDDSTTWEQDFALTFRRSR